MDGILNGGEPSIISEREQRILEWAPGTGNGF